MKSLWKTLVSVVLCAAVCLCAAAPLSGCASKGVSPQGSTPAADSAETVEPTKPQPLPDCSPLTGAARDTTAALPRPVAVMIDNARAALPQSGLAAAYGVYEMVTEGGIPRLMAVFSSTAALGKVGPVRSTRDQFVQLLAPENLQLLHIGSSIYAADMLRSLEYGTVDGIYLGTVAFAFDEARAQTRDNSHCFYTSAALADAGIAHEELSTTAEVEPLFCFVPYDRPARVPDTFSAGKVTFAFSQTADVAFQYNAETARYSKSEYGDPSMDEAAGTQLSYTNLLVLGCTVSLKSDGLCTDFDFSQGDGYYFSQGGGQPVHWKKGGVTDRLLVYDDAGNELTVNVGSSYIAFVDTRALRKTLCLDNVPVSDRNAANGNAAEETFLPADSADASQAASGN